jgi:hypothetical protein
MVVNTIALFSPISSGLFNWCDSVWSNQQLKLVLWNQNENFMFDMYCCWLKYVVWVVHWVIMNQLSLGRSLSWTDTDSYEYRKKYFLVLKMGKYLQIKKKLQKQHTVPFDLVSGDHMRSCVLFSLVHVEVEKKSSQCRIAMTIQKREFSSPFPTNENSYLPLFLVNGQDNDGITAAYGSKCYHHVIKL